ncbi:MAG: tRNA (5-methylaminomethyl-2-thiouridine)(34)-methyltransferase MnmD [Roseibium sp.]|nr:tRNA (5-methylaminomethyl-2-thiouridine)(34)-methyltransferase MnmD [Roseibium sp.]
METEATGQRKIADRDVSAPELDWIDEEVPRAARFDDTYFSRAGGLAETRHVFLGGNDLPARFEGRSAFTIGELGFGTGLNFLATLSALKPLTVRPHLTFISFELYPLTTAQLERALAAFPELQEEADRLLAIWAPKPGWNRFDVAGASVRLGVGDARELIDGLQLDPQSAQGADLHKMAAECSIAPVEAWFLDGFSPAKNPELWEADLLRKVGALTAPDGTLATYSAAGWVRRNLEAAGFTVEKRAGFAGKREMVTGRRQP